MEMEKRIKLLEFAYAGALADAVLRYTREGVLEKVTEDKKKELQFTAARQNQAFGVKEPADVFLNLSEVFNCAKWEISKEADKVVAVNQSCMLCGLTKQMNAGNPCDIFCLNPMQAMITALGDFDYQVDDTLWTGKKCKVVVTQK